MLIPVTHPTQCVVECAKCRFSRQANTTWGPLPKRSPIQYGRPNYIGAYVHTKCTSQNSSRKCTCNRVVAYRDCLTHKPITTQHLVLPDASALPLGLVYWDWLCDDGWTLGMGQWDIYIFPMLRSVPYSRTDTGNSHAHTFHFGMINLRPLVPMPYRCLSQTRGFNVGKW